MRSNLREDELSSSTARKSIINVDRVPLATLEKSHTSSTGGREILCTGRQDHAKQVSSLCDQGKSTEKPTVAENTLHNVRGEGCGTDQDPGRVVESKPLVNIAV